MSHFSVLVIGPDPDKQLQPYHEFECTGTDDQYVVSIDETQEMREEYEGRAEEDKGMTFLQWVTGWTGRNIIRSGIPVDTKKKHKYGWVEVDEHDNVIAVVDRTNPNKKWDWYVVGGRWTGYFKLRPGTEGILGRPGLMTEPGKAGYADVVRKGDVDIQGMRDEAGAEAAVTFDHFAPAFAGGKTIPSWDEIRARHGDENIEAARAEHNSNPVGEAIRRLDTDHRTMFVGDLRTFFCNGDREAFIQRARDRALSTFAVVKDGQWYEKGEMGWFGCVHNEKDPGAWEREFARLVNDLPDDTLLTLVDCHI